MNLNKIDYIEVTDNVYSSTCFFFFFCLLKLEIFFLIKEIVLPILIILYHTSRPIKLYCHPEFLYLISKQ